MKRGKTETLLASVPELPVETCNCLAWPDCWHWAADGVTTDRLTPRWSKGLGEGGQLAAEQRADLLAGRPVPATPAERRSARRYRDKLHRRNRTRPMTTTETPITADQIIELFPTVTRPHAERLTTYIDLRRQGQRPVDALAGTGLDNNKNTRNRYERWAAAVLAALKLPPLTDAKGPVRLFTADPFFYSRRGQ